MGNLHVLGAMYLPGLYYERGLLHPFIDYDVSPPWVNSTVDPLEDEGNVHTPPHWIHGIVRPFPTHLGPAVYCPLRCNKSCGAPV